MKKSSYLSTILLSTLILSQSSPILTFAETTEQSTVATVSDSSTSDTTTPSAGLPSQSSTTEVSSSTEESSSTQSSLTDTSETSTSVSAEQVPAQTVTETASEEEEAAFVTQTLYRLYHPGLKVHLYTLDKNEYQVLGTRGWKQEGLAWQVETSGRYDKVYRLYHPGLKVHLYTKDANEYQVLANRGWKQEGTAFYSYGTIPIYRLYHPGIKRHLYTKDVNEYNILGQRSWKQEGIAFYGFDRNGTTPPSPTPQPKPVDPKQKALDELEAAKKALKEAQDKEASAKVDLANAMQRDASKPRSIQELKEKQKAQQATAAKTAQELTQANSLAREAKAKKDAADKQVADLTKQIQDIKSMTKITLSEEVITKWHAYAKTLGQQDANAMNNLQDSLDSWWDVEYQKIKFGITAPIDDTVVDPNNLSDKQVKMLSHYYAFLVNNLREQVGVNKKMVVTEESVKAIQQIANNYSKENKPWSSGHSRTALLNDGVDNMFYTTENFAGSDYATNTTMTDMFEEVYFNVISFMVYDREHNFGHLNAILISRTGHDADLVGMDVSITPNGVVRNHYVTFSKRDYNKLQSPFDTSELEARLATAKTQQATANTNHTKAQTQLQAATTANNTAQSALKATTDALNKLLATPDQTPAAKAALTQATAAVTAAQARLAKAQQVVSAFTN